MRFSISHASENNLNIIVLKDEQTGSGTAILPQYGAMLHAFRLLLGGKPVNVIDNYNSAEHLEKELSASFKSSRLSPFVCRIPQGKYVFDGKEYEFQHKFIDGSAIHGLLYDKPFTVMAESADEGKASVTMQYNYQKEDAGYPYYYRCEVQYTLKADNLLQIQSTVSNLSDTVIPVADGWHPYFQLGGKIDDWLMNFHADAILEFDDNLIPTGRLLPYHTFNEPKHICNLELDNCFLLKKDYTGPACRLVNPANQLTLSFFPDAAYPYLQIYTPPRRNSIAIENLSAAPDSFNNKMGLLLLSAGDSRTFTVLYQLSAV